MSNELGKLNLNDYKPLREIVFESIRAAIIDGTLKPGERLMEVQLAENLGVSRTPVREAIRKLELEGLIVMVPRKGAYVADVSLKDIMNALEIRGVLEGLVATLASERITEQEMALLKSTLYSFHECLMNGDFEGMLEKDTEFHEIIYKAARNQKLTSMLDDLRQQVKRFRQTYMTSIDKSTKLTEEHNNILEAIENKDPQSAKKYAEEHIKSVREFMSKEFKGKLNK